jgi:hypothetical protein
MLECELPLKTEYLAETELCRRGLKIRSCESGVGVQVPPRAPPSRLTGNASLMLEWRFVLVALVVSANLGVASGGSATNREALASARRWEARDSLMSERGSQPGEDTPAWADCIS